MSVSDGLVADLTSLRGDLPHHHPHSVKTVIHKARNWWLVDFWPETADDFMKVSQALGTQQNAWLRQVAGY